MPNTTPTLPVGLGTRPLALPGNAAVGDELERAGLAFGDLVLGVGSAVADTQRTLNETGAALATTLATTVVDVIAVQETQYNDSGEIQASVSHVRPLPLISFIDPVFYQWRYVRLQGQFYASEFAGATKNSSYVHNANNEKANSGLIYVLGGGYHVSKYSSTDTTTSTDKTTDVSVGSVRMNAMLEPRSDVSIPAARQTIVGPNITALSGEIADELDAAIIVGRTMNVTLELHRRDGTAIPGKELSIETSGVPWSYTGAHTTDTDGRVEIQLRREFLTPEADRSPTQVVVTARRGMVSNDTTVTF